jgi:phage shock protein PspC (stress-responsive transcriptional regulator)
MKKNISINISGIIFHIEEDGYDALKRYLDSIQKYFSSFEDSSEIIADIESRIAEIFLTKLNEGKQIITSEDVKSLIATMGSVSDFKAAEEEFQEESTESKTGSQQAHSYHSTANKQLYRDQNRKILGGVCAGLANYFNVDAVWVRLFFALLTAGWGFGILIYLVMWIATPGSYELEEPQISKKLFRDNERKVLGGVCGGLAAYFDIDVVIIRLIFIITAIFGGLGLVAYIVMWIVLPAAVSITDKMQMQGEPVTLSNIESTIKRGLGKEGEEESALTKIILFPFRLIGMIITGLGKILGPVMDVVRVGIGILITMLGLTLLFALIMSTGILFGLITDSSIPFHLGGPFNSDALPLDAISRAIPTSTAVAAFFAALIPGIMITLLGISAIAKRIVFSNVVGWAIFFTFIVSLAVLGATVPKIAYDFKEDAEVKTETTYNLNGKTAILQLHETGLDEYDAATLTLRGYDGNELKLVQSIESQGRNRKTAIENTKMIDYHVDVTDTVFTFDSNLRFKDDAVFRAQRMKMTLYIPYQQKFILTDNMWRLLSQYIDYENRDNNTWHFTTDGLRCLTCPVQSSESTNSDNSDNAAVGFSDEYGLTNFNELSISGIFDVRITQADRYSIELVGPDKEKRKYKISQAGRKLYIKYDDDNKITFRNNPLKLDKIRINISLPELEELELKGAGKASFRNFEADDLTIEALGAVEVTGGVNANNITVELSGACVMNLSGKANTMDATIQGASKLKAYDFVARDVAVEANGASSAKVHATRRLEIKEGIASDVDYRGDPSEVIKN